VVGRHREYIREIGIRSGEMGDPAHERVRCKRGDGAGGAGNVGTDIDALYNRWITYEYFYFSHRATIAHIRSFKRDPQSPAYGS
jgi:hypothetical protein